jgi:haloalkane dehalogenase
MIAGETRYTKRKIEVLGHQMAYIEVGQGDPIVLLHGNPTSSYLWRNILPYLENLGRCIVPDLIGMGDSDKLTSPDPDRYRLVEHRRFLDAFLEKMKIGPKIVLVMHDWGGPLGFDWANRHRAAVAGLAYMETLVRPLSWDDFPAALQGLIRTLRSPEGEKLVLEQNADVEKVLPGAVLRPLTAEEMAVYRQPYLEPGESRRPTLAWLREIPLDGAPADVATLIQNYAEWLSTSDLPKLFINAEPGSILVGAVREFCRSWPNQTEVTVKGSHYIQEDSPGEIGQAIAAWYRALKI